MTRNSKKNGEINGDIKIIFDRLWEAYFPSSLSPSSSYKGKLVPALYPSGESLAEWLTNSKSLYPMPSPDLDRTKDHEIIQSLDQASAVCQLYQREILNGGVMGYLGKEFSTSDSPGKTSASSIRPCLHIHGGL